MKLLRVFAWLYPAYLQMNVAAAVVGSAVVGGVMSSKAAGKASDAQTEAAEKSDATQRYMFDETNKLNAPFRNAGVAGINELQYRMGLGGGSVGGASSSAYSAPKTYEQLRDELKGSYQTSVGNGQLTELARRDKAAYDDWRTTDKDYRGDWNPDWNQYFEGGRNGGSPLYRNLQWQMPAATSDAYDQQGLEAAIQKRLAQQSADQRAAQQSTASDPNYGSLLKNYGKEDADNDYIYQTQKQFGLDEGTKGLNRIAAASGNFLSGAAVKALTRFGVDYAGTKLGESYNRFENNKTGVYNKLAGISGVGQQATNQVAAAGQNMANNISANQIGVGNARGASAIAGANSFNNMLGSGVNAYQQNQLMNSYKQPAAYSGWAGQGGFGDSYGTSYGE